MGTVWIRGAALLAVLLWLGAPARAETSLAEALKIIDEARGEKAEQGNAGTAVPFVPPPRSIEDITAILDRQKPDAAKIAANRAAADAQPPGGGASKEALADFFFKRALAADEIGRARQRLDDLKKAHELARQGDLPPATQLRYLQQLAFASEATGDVRGALAIQDERQQLLERARLPRGPLFNIFQNKISYATRLGRIDLARGTLAEQEKLYVESARWSNPSPLQRSNFRAQLLIGRTVVAKATGHYAEAEAAARESVTIASQLMGSEESLQVPPGTFANLRDINRGSLADALLGQGKLVEAEAEARQALLSRLERFGRYAPETAGDVILLARVLFEERRHPESEKLSQAARDIYETLGYEPATLRYASTLTWMARAQVAQGKTDAARQTYGILEQALRNDAELRRNVLEGDSSYGLMLVRTGRAADAIAIMAHNLELNRARFGENSYAAAASHGWLAVASQKAGETARARSEFEIAVPTLISLSSESEASGSIAQRERIVQLIVEGYLGLLAEADKPAEEMFRLADAVRGKAVERALAEASARLDAADPALADLVRHEQDAEKQIPALQGLLNDMLSQPSSEQNPAAGDALRQRIEQLRLARTRIREEIGRRFPSYAALIDPKPATVAEVQRNLRPGEALIATYVGDERLFVWAVPQQGQVAFSSTKIAGREVGRLVTGLRKALDADIASVDAVPGFDLAIASKLYAMLLKPVEPGWAGASSLIVVPHRSLGQLPFGLLVSDAVSLPGDGGTPFAGYRGVPFLIRKAAVTQLPSVAALAMLRSLPAPQGSRETFAGFGDPLFSPEQAKAGGGEDAKGQKRGAGTKTAALETRGVPLHRRSAPTTIDAAASATLAMLPRLPDTAEEVRSIALALHADLKKDVFLGVAASEKNVSSATLGKRRIIVFATHGLVPGDLDGLFQPALALSNPAVAGGGGDGLLTVGKILTLKLDADWVVLSACNTAAAQGVGAEAVSGLGRAFFYAGTRALLVSNWPVESDSAHALTTDLFRRIAADPNLSRAEALRQSELALIDGPGAVDSTTKRPLFSYAHPIFWAPFTLVGDGG